MISLNTENLAEFNIKMEEDSIKNLLEKIHSRKQGFYTLVEDEDHIEKIKEFARKAEGKFDYIVVLGIGGSALGTICLKQSLKHLFESELKTKKYPALYVLDNIDPTLITQLEDVIDYSKTLFIVVSKSGSTPETGMQYFYFRQKINEKKLDPKKHFVFITDPKEGFLRQIANEENITTFDVPQNVTGRFSVLKPVSLLPAKLIGIDISKILAGAKNMRNKFLNEDPQENLPFQLAKIQYELYKKGKIINVLMPYSQRLIGLTDWYRQLLAESIGKNEQVGITPIKALGVTDQHSQLQLYNDGPNDKLIIFIEVKNFGPELLIPNVYPEKKELKFLNKGFTFNTLVQIEKRATAQSLTKKHRPNITISIDQIDEAAMGELLMFFMCSIAFLGELFKINAFDQPGVELVKKLTKKAIIKG